MYNNVDENASLRCEDFTRYTCEWSTLFSKRGLIQWPSAHTVSAQVEPSSIPSAFHHSANTKTAAWEVHQRITDKKKRKEKLAFPFFHPQNICRNRLDNSALLEAELCVATLKKKSHLPGWDVRGLPEADVPFDFQWMCATYTLFEISYCRCNVWNSRPLNLDVL